MWTINVRVGAAEFATLFLLLAVAVLSAVGLRSGGLWMIAIVPGLTYLLAIGTAYALYRRYVSERAQAAESAIETVAFRVVDAQGVCPVGRRQGDLVRVALAGSITPALCAEAEAVLRLAAAPEAEQKAKRWSCPIYDHLLVFEREPTAA